ncbi:MAG TPA: VOC family protein [Acidimicrobiales bacterium]
MRERGLLRKVDAVTVRVPDLDSGLAFYRDALGHRLRWRDDAMGQAGLELPDGDGELVLTTGHGYEPNWLVDSVDEALDTLRRTGGTVLAEPRDIPVGRLAVVADPFGNPLVVLDLSTGTYATDAAGRVTGVATDAAGRVTGVATDAAGRVTGVASGVATDVAAATRPEPDHRFTADDLLELTALAARSWLAGSGRDWSAPAGTLDWSCTDTAVHTVDTVVAPAFFLASRKRDGYPGFGVSAPGPDTRPEALVEALETAARLLWAVVAAAGPDARAVIWRRPRVEVRGPEDFPARAALELALHTHDICAGLALPFRPPDDLCDRLRRQTRDWPHWSSPGWSALRMEGDPWADLLRASGRHPAPPA